MPTLGKILLADDEQIFRDSTAELLRREGYSCDCVPDSQTAIEKLMNASYDLLIADIKMPGNPDLELIKKLSKLSAGTPAILVTGFPTQTSAIESVKLPVSAYMVKPLDFEELKKNIETALQKKQLFNTVLNTKSRLEKWHDDISAIENFSRESHNKEFTASVTNFLDLTLCNISAAFSDIKSLTEILTNDAATAPVCNLMNCPKLSKMSDGILETVRTLEKTKSSFKSKELGLLREKLEDILRKTKKV